MADDAFDISELLETLSQRESPVALDLGCGGGRMAFELASRGFHCIAVDRALPATRFDNVTYVEADLRAFDLEAASYDLIIAKNVLQFLSATDKRIVFRRAFRALRAGGLIIVEAFTVDDPSYLTAKHAQQEIDLNTYRDASGVTSYFAAGELKAWAAAEGATILAYDEVVARDDHAPYGPHDHGLAFLAACSPATLPAFS